MCEKMVETLLQLGLIAKPQDVDNPGLLNAAVEKGDLKIVEDLLKYGVDVNMGDNSNYGLTPLHIAVNGDQVKMVKLLISYGADVNAEDEDEDTPIECAIERKATEITKLLLINGAHIKGNCKVLRTAIKNGSLTIVEDLLNYGIDVNMEIHHIYSWTPLILAVQRGQAKIAKVLINYGANLNLKDSDGMTPIKYAIENGDTKINKLLLTNGVDIKEDPKLLSTAIRTGNLKIIEDLLKHGADVNMLNKPRCGSSLMPLHNVVNGKQVEMVKLLIKYGADVNVIDDKGTKPIAYSIQNGDTEITKLLLTNGADIKKDCDLLFAAIRSGSLKIVEDLLNYGANVNASDNSSRTALHYTLVRYDVCKKDIAELLLSKGANVNVTTYDNKTILCDASREGYEDFVEMLLKYGAECDPKGNRVIKPLHAAAVGGHSKIIENLLKFGAEVNSRDIYGRTALHFASRKGHEEVVKTLLEYGSDVNIISKKNHTPLEYSRLVLIDSDVEYNIDDDDDYHYNLWNDENLSYTDDFPTSNLLKQHIAKMKAAGLHVSQRNLLGISNDHEINNFLYKCEAEIEIMKSQKIGNSYTSFYDILKKNSIELANNTSIVHALKSDDYTKKFPIYASMIDSQFTRGICRKRRAAGTSSG